MNEKINVVSMRSVEDVATISVNCARFQGSEPFSGEFQVADTDLCIGLNPESNKQIAFVYCHLGDCDTDDEMLEIEIDDPVIHTTEGFFGQVIDRIDFAT